MVCGNLVRPTRCRWGGGAGAFSGVRGGAFAIAVGPALWIALALAAGWIAAEPLKQATHLSGTWTLYFLLGTLAVTPLMRLLAWSRLATIRRLLGVTAFAYVAGPPLLSILNLAGNVVRAASALAPRPSPTPGFTAVL